MSIVLNNIGKRMLSVRTKLSYPQSKMAAILNIADKSYKNYELEKTELPLSVAVKFCDEFEVDLMWLIYGSNQLSTNLSAKLAGDTVKALLELIDKEVLAVTPEKFGKYAEYIFNQSVAKGTSPIDEAKQFFTVVNSEA